MMRLKARCSTQYRVQRGHSPAIKSSSGSMQFALPTINFLDIRYLNNGVDRELPDDERGTTANDLVIAVSGKGALMHEHPTRDLSVESSRKRSR